MSYQDSTPYAQKLPDSTLFPAAARYLNLQYAHLSLVYQLRRPDNTISASWTEYFLRRYRAIKTEYLDEVYDNMSALVLQLQMVIRLEESCTKSGAYKKDLDSARERLSVLLQALESDDKRHQYLEAMLR